MTELYEAAREYHCRRLPITLCKPGCKKPYVNGWPSKQWTLREIDAEFRRHGNLNVGVVLGQRSKLIDIEYDSHEGDRALLELFDGDVPVAPTWASTRSPHRLFRAHPALETIGKSSISLGPLEIRLGANGKGAQSLLPPSVTDGHQRAWDVPLSECAPPPLSDRVVQHILRENAAKSACLAVNRETENTERTEAMSLSSPSTLSSLPLCKPHQVAITDAIHATLPSSVGQRNRLLFTFARQLKAIPSLADADARSMRPIVKQWHQAALPFIGTQPFDETWADFCIAWEKVKFPAGHGPIFMIYQQAMLNPVPRAAEQYETDSLRRLVAVCRELQHVAGEEPFYLDCRTAGALLGVSHVMAHKWLQVLVIDGVLRLVRRGTQGSATRYRYVGD
jgi:hypothetical protein